MGQVEIYEVHQAKNAVSADKVFVDSLRYLNDQLQSRVAEEKTSLKAVTAKGFRFERKLKTYEAPETQEAKPPGMRNTTRQAIAIYRIYRIADNKLIFMISGETYFNYKGGEIREPLVEDVDFDGWPDLVIPNLKGSQIANRYFGYDAKKEVFSELFISLLMDLKIDKKKQKATGFRFSGHTASPVPSYKIHYTLQGPGLPIVHERKEELPQPERKPQAPNLVLFSKIENNFLIEFKL